MENGKWAQASETRGGAGSRRRALALMLGAGPWLPGALSAAGTGAPVRMAFSESLVSDVNLNDARAALQVLIQRIAQHANLTVELDPKVFETTEEILARVRKGLLDAVALNVIEFRQGADVLDSSQIVSEAGAAATEQYIIVVKRDGGIRRLGDLEGRRLYMLKTPKMCLAPAWLSIILDEGRCGPAEQFFASVTADSKSSRVVLPVFFGQAEACLTSKRGFDTMCELNPQVARDLQPLAASPPMVINFYVFRKTFQGAYRDKLLAAIGIVCQGAAGQQLSALFQFNALMVRDASCLASALSVVERAERVRSPRRGAEQPGRGRERD